jgi:mono/diheme cytochrome c family protein
VNDEKRDEASSETQRREIRRADHVGPEVGDVQDMHRPILRERTEPRDGYEPIPMWVIALFGVLLFWGGWYVGEYSGGWQWNVMDEDPGARFGADAGDGPKDPLVVGERLYKALCVSCHQAGGQGVSGQYPPLSGSRYVLESPPRLKRILLHGLEGPIEVQGATYNGNMPAFREKLDDERLAAVLTWIRQAFGNEAPPITPESVAATRQATADRRAPWRVAELEDLPADHAPPAEPESGSAEGADTGG